MSAGFKKTMVVAGITVAGLVAAASPAYAKSDSTLTGPGWVHARHAFHLTVQVGDDGGARAASARLQVRYGRGQFHWDGGWHRLRLTDMDDESYVFTVAGRHPGPETFRAAISSGYAPTNTVTVVVR
jgi:hypothetical protein